ncbi:PEP-CTERM sorting domain-containing protein [Nitrospira sp. Nam74]
MGLMLFFFLLLPLPVQGLTLQDLVDQGSFSAGGSTFSNFAASTHIATYSIGGGPAPLIPDCCTFSTLDEIQVDLMPDGFLISNIYGSGQSDNGLHGMPSDFHLALAFDSFPRPVRLTDVTLGGAWSPFTTASLDETLSHPVTYHYTASLGIQISPHCSHTHSPLFPCDFSFHEGSVTVTTNVPEPSTAALMIAGVPGLAMLRNLGRKHTGRSREDS